MTARRFAAAAALLLCAAAPAAAQDAHKKLKAPGAIPFVDDGKKPAADAAPKKAAGVPLLPGSGSKEPVNISADKLDFLNKENKLIYSGNVVVVQGDSTMKASVLNIDLQRDAQGGAGATAPATPAPADGAAPAAGNSSVRHMEADGPVTLISKDQVGTGDHARYDKGENRVYLDGHVTLSQGTNVTQGDHLVYNMTTGQAQVTGQRVSSVFTPGSSAPGDASKAAPPVVKTKPTSPPPATKTKPRASRADEAAR